MDINALFTNPDWGSLADWFAASGTIAAVVIALNFGLADRQRLKIERKEAAEDRRIFRQERAEQAEADKRRIASKVTVLVEGFWLGDLEAENGRRRSIKWEVHNGGDEPISMVCVVQTLTPKAPGAAEAPYQIDHVWPAIKPGQTVNHTQAFYRDSSDFLPFREVWFTDSAGQRWRRNQFGTLDEIAKGDPRANGAIPVAVP
ncbi:hypothetical protein ACFRJ9_19795 [Paenarthrobacter sp. NPDC056912]|uniref:hypothetical protein n=1 Tax=Paenarthrobacter sp. NPDC056912 TaxID=3345965 RepID=UPI00366B3A43